MPINIVWEDAQRRVMRHEYPTRWTLEEYKALMTRSAKLLRGIDHTVHIIVDRRKSDAVPTNILSLARYIDKLTPPNQGLVVYVQPSAFTQTLLKASTRIAPRATANLHCVDTISDAYHLIVHADDAIETQELRLVAE